MDQRHGRRRVVLGSLAGALALFGVRGVAMAKPAQNVFVDECKKAGGTSSSVGAHVVRCNQVNFDTTCDFNYKPPRCRDRIH